MPETRTTADSRRTFPARLTALADVRAFVREMIRQTAVPEDTAMDIVLAVSEAGSNAILHSGTPELEVEWTASPGRIVVLVRDRGIFASPDGRERPVTAGLGTGLMRATMDRVIVDAGHSGRPGTTVRLEKHVRGRVA